MLLILISQLLDYVFFSQFPRDSIPSIVLDCRHVNFVDVDVKFGQWRLNRSGIIILLIEIVLIARSDVVLISALLLVSFSSKVEFKPQSKDWWAQENANSNSKQICRLLLV